MNLVRLDNLELEEALVNLRDRIGLLGRLIPDNIIVPEYNIADPSDWSVSDITPPEKLFELPALKPHGLIRDLSNDDITRPKFLSTGLVSKIDDFVEIAQDFHEQLFQSQKLMLSNTGNLELIMQNPVAQSVVSKQLVPERWDHQLLDMELLIRKISRAYLVIDATQGCDSSHTEGMRNNINVLKEALDDMYRASKNALE